MTRTPLSIYEQLIQRNPKPPLTLDEEIYWRPLSEEIERLSSSQHVKAALHLLNDDIERSHNYAELNQGDDLFDYIHAVIHRRQMDFWNSKWYIRWFDRVKHPLLSKVYNDSITPHKFVQKVEELEVADNPKTRSVLEDLQFNELKAICDCAIRNT